MRIGTIAYVLTTALLLVFVGCSKSDQGSSELNAADTTKRTADMPTSANNDSNNNDSLATVRGAIRDSGNQCVTLLTNYGSLTLELYHDVAPNHADSFVARTIEGFYDSTIFHRVIDKFMIQGGDPTGTGSGQAPYQLQAEFNELPHVEGTLSMARSMDPNSASCQFFICLERNQATTSLDKKYTVFGHLIKGYDVLHKIGAVEKVPSPNNPREVSKPKEDVRLIHAYVSDPEGNPKE